MEEKLPTRVGWCVLTSLERWSDEMNEYLSRRGVAG